MFVYLIHVKTMLHVQTITLTIHVHVQKTILVTTVKQSKHVITAMHKMLYICRMNVTIPVTNMPVLLVVIGIVSGTVGGFLLLILITLIVIVLIYAVKKEKSKNGIQILL